jgi:hypothetical protein
VLGIGRVVSQWDLVKIKFDLASIGEFVDLLKTIDHHEKN